MNQTTHSKPAQTSALPLTGPNLTARPVNVDFPTWMVEGLDRRAAHLGITRQALIKIRIADQLG